MTDWYAHDPWKVYAGWLSPTWALPRADFDPVMWCDQLQRAGFRNVIVHAKHHDGICFFPTRFRDAAPPRDYFGELAIEAHRRGMRVLTYYSTTFDSITAQERPDLCCRERDGSITVLRWPPYPMGVCCHNNPGYRELLLGQLAEVQDAYDTDGFWMDGFDYTGYPSHACYCHYCLERYARDTGRDLMQEPGVTEAMKLWHRDVFLELLHAIQEIASADGRDRVVTYNAAGTDLELGYETLDPACTVLSAEAHTPIHKSVFCRLLAAQARPFEIYTPNSDKVFSWTPRTDAQLDLDAAIVAAHGGSVLVGLDVTASGHIPEWQVEQLRGVRERMLRYEAEIAGASPVADVGLLLPKDQWKREDGGWHVLLLRNHIPFAVLPLHATDLAPYRVVIVTDGFPVTEDLAARLREYVAGGGRVIVERDAAGARDNTFLLADLLGVEPIGDTGFSTTYIGEVAETLCDGLWDEPIRCDGRAWKLRCTSAETLARFVYPVAEYSQERWLWREPNPPRRAPSADAAITVNRVGRGQAVYVACALEGTLTPQHRMFVCLLANLLRSLDPEPLIRSEAPPCVEVVVSRRSDADKTRHIVHFLNHYTAASGVFDRDAVPTLTDVGLWLNERRIGRACRMARVGDSSPAGVEREGNWVRVHVPQLGVHEIAIVETQPSGAMPAE